MKNIIILFGGRSCEHDISIITAMQVLNAADKTKFKIYPIYITQNGEWFLAENLNQPQDFINFNPNKFKQVFLGPASTFLHAKTLFGAKKIANINCAILCNHGVNGEDGSLQGLLQLSQIPHTSSDVCSSAICMDKIFMKQIFEVNNLPTTNYFWFKKQDWASNQGKIISTIKQKLDFPLIVKPANLGSSIGINIAKTQAELEKSIQTALEFDDKILVEEVVPNLIEINCAVLNNCGNLEISRLERPLSWNKFLSFDQKYLHFSKQNRKKTKLSIPKNVQADIKKMAKVAFEKLDCDGVVRIDFLVNARTDEIFINEINNIPGAFANFLFPQYSFTEFINILIANAIDKHNKANQKTFAYKSNVLTQSGVIKIKK